MEKYVSIILPAYKGRYFREAIDSILSQSYPFFELVIVDDASPENLQEIVANYDDVRIRYYRNPTNLGAHSLVQSWNHAITFARYEYLVLASDDDIYHSDFLAEMVALSDKYPTVDLFRSRVAIIDGNGTLLHTTAIAPEYETTTDFIRGRISGQREMFVPEFMCRREVLNAIGGFVDFPSAWGSDSATWYAVSRYGGVVCSDKVLFSFRMSGINISSGGYIENKLSALSTYNIWLHGFVSQLGADGQYVDDIIRRITPYFEEQKLRILKYAPIKYLSKIFWNVPAKDKLLIVKAILLKIRAKINA